MKFTSTLAALAAIAAGALAATPVHKVAILDSDRPQIEIKKPLAFAPGAKASTVLSLGLTGATDDGLAFVGVESVPTPESNNALVWFNVESGKLQLTTSVGTIELGAGANTGISTALQKGDGSGGLTNAVAGTDYLSPTGDGSGLTGFTNSQIPSALAGKTYNGLTISSSTGTITIGNGKTLTLSNSLTFSGTDGSTLNIGAGGTLGSAAFTASSSYLTPTGNGSGLTSLSASNISSGSLSLTRLAQGGAVSGQVLAWDGSQYLPTTVSGTGTVTSFSAGSTGFSVSNASTTPTLSGTLGYGGGGTNSSTQAGARNNLGGTRKGIADGGSLSGVTPDYLGQLAPLEDRGIAVATGTSAGNWVTALQLSRAGSNDNRSFLPWMNFGNMTVYGGLHTQGLNVGNLISIDAASSFVDNALDIWNPTAHSAIAFWQGDDSVGSGRALAVGIGGSNGLPVYNGVAYIATNPLAASPTSDPPAIGIFNERQTGMNFIRHRRAMFGIDGISLYGLQPDDTTLGPLALEVDPDGNVDLVAGGGALTINGTPIETAVGGMKVGQADGTALTGVAPAYVGQIASAQDTLISVGVGTSPGDFVHVGQLYRTASGDIRWYKPTTFFEDITLYGNLDAQAPHNGGEHRLRANWDGNVASIVNYYDSAFSALRFLDYQEVERGAFGIANPNVTTQPVFASSVYIEASDGNAGVAWPIRFVQTTRYTGNALPYDEYLRQAFQENGDIDFFKRNTTSAAAGSSQRLLHLTDSSIALGESGQSITLGSGTGLAKLSSGVLGIATAGTDYVATPRKSLRTFTALDAFPPSSNFATLGLRNSRPTLVFADNASNQETLFMSSIPNDAVLTSGLSVVITWTTPGTSGNGRFGAQIERMNTDIDSDSFDSATEVTTACNGTSGIPSTTTITLTNIDSVASGEPYVLKVYRDCSDSADTLNSTTVEILTVEIKTAN